MAAENWADLRPGMVAELGDEMLAEARRRTQGYIDAHRLAEQRKAHGPTRCRIQSRSADGDGDLA